MGMNKHFFENTYIVGRGPHRGRKKSVVRRSHILADLHMYAIPSSFGSGIGIYVSSIIPIVFGKPIALKLFLTCII
jgi:hypothetical protein